MMTHWKRDAQLITDNIAKIDGGLTKHKEQLLEIFSHGHSSRHDEVLHQFDEIVDNWKTMVEAQYTILNMVEQNTLINSIEIIGVPEGYATNIPGVVYLLTHLLRIVIDDSFVLGFERKGTSDPRILIVHLVNQNIKKRILAVADSVVLKLGESDMPLYIREHLTRKNNELYSRAREEALRQHILYVWIDNAKILVRRNETSPVYEIRCDADIRGMAHI